MAKVQSQEEIEELHKAIQKLIPPFVKLTKQFLIAIKSDNPDDVELLCKSLTTIVLIADSEGLLDR